MAKTKKTKKKKVVKNNLYQILIRVKEGGNYNLLDKYELSDNEYNDVLVPILDNLKKDSSSSSVYKTKRRINSNG